MDSAHVGTLADKDGTPAIRHRRNALLKDKMNRSFSALPALIFIAGCNDATPAKPLNLVWNLQGSFPPMSRLDPLPDGLRQGASGGFMIRGPGTLTLTIAPDETYTIEFDAITVVPDGTRIEGLLIYLSPQSVEAAHERGLAWAEKLRLSNTSRLDEWWKENRRANQILPMSGQITREAPEHVVGLDVSYSISTERTTPVCVNIGMNFKPLRQRHGLSASSSTRTATKPVTPR